MLPYGCNETPCNAPHFGRVTTTDFQFKTILKMVLDILEGSENIEEAKEKVKRLLEEEQ